MQTYSLEITGMSCDHCTAKVANAAESAGADRCEVDLEAGRASVTFNESKASITSIVQAVGAAGYTVGGFRRVDAASSASQH